MDCHTEGDEKSWWENEILYLCDDPIEWAKESYKKYLEGRNGKAN